MVSPMMFKDPTRRAYTLRLAPPHGEQDHAGLWQKLWETHDLVNRGTKVLGDLWLNLRGGLNADLAKDAPKPSDAQVLLALGWLTVEAPATAVPEDAILARPTQGAGERATILVRRLEAILKADGIPNDEVREWVDSCRPTFAAGIREDAVWVDRRGEFDRAAATLRWTGQQAKEMFVDDMMDKVEGYLSIDESGGEGEKKDYAQKAGGWISRNWGTGKKSDTNAILGKLKAVTAIPLDEFRDRDCESLLKAIHAAVRAEGNGEPGVLLKKIIKSFGWKGRGSAGRMALEKIAEETIVTDALITRIKTAFEKEIADKTAKADRSSIGWASDAREWVERTTGLPFRTEKDHIWEYGVMLDHALRRISIAHSWAKRAEVSRQQFQEAANQPADAAVFAWVEEYCAQREVSSGALGEYLIRKNALEGWKEVCLAWQELGVSAGPDERIKAARDLQDEVEKFGDIQLFEALAVADVSLWSRAGNADPELLSKEAARRVARHDQTRFKVPAYRHPDALLNPVFCDYGNSRWKIWYSAQEGEACDNPRTVTLDTYGDGRISASEFRWQSKRFFHEIAGGAGQKKGVEGSRNHRHAHAIHADGNDPRLRTAGIFNLKDWNGRLQAPRVSLEKIHRLRSRNAGPEAIDRAFRRIPWLVTFSAPLLPEGPWLDFVESDPSLKGLDVAKKLAPKGGFDYFGLAFPFDHPANGKTRKKAARLGLARLHGLRILSADLGHRHAAACAVWRTMSGADMAARCVAAGTGAPDSSALFLHLREEKKTTVFRRIGDDLLPGGETHPAPWAELERQFLIRLPGEDTQARYANPAEREETARIEKLMGARIVREPKDWRMDRLQSGLVRLARLGLRRHATMVRLALGLGARERTLPGGRVVPFSGREDRLAYVADLLSQQHRLLLDDQFPDDATRERWKEFAAGCLTEADLTPGQQGPRRDNGSLAKRLQKLAARFIENDPAALGWVAHWRETWQAMDGRWREAIKAIRKILLPKPGKADKTIRRRGGLSMARVTAIEEFRRKVQVAYFTRQKLHGERLEMPKAFASKTLARLEKMRQNRVRQIASRIASAALGIGPDPANGNRLTKRHPACHAVVIEDLSNYRPESTQTRRENRQLMQWSSGKVRKLLAEACQLAGLHLREVSPAFTSRQDSRTGAPGLRCAEISWSDFRKPGGYWSRVVDKARERKEAGKAGPVDAYLTRLADAAGTPPTATVLVPARGAELFCSASDAGPIALQADLNAAANIGLAALNDPDWNGRWWFVPASRETHKPVQELAVTVPMAGLEPLPANDSNLANRSGKRTKGKAGTDVRHFRDASSDPLGKRPWFVGFPAYEAEFSRRVTIRLERRFLPLPETPF